MKHQIAIVFLSLLVAAPASAQYELKSGLNYTSVSKPKKAKPAAPATEAATPTLHVSQDKKETADPATIVWEKYKALATGQAAEEEQSAPQKSLSSQRNANKTALQKDNSKNDPNNPNARKSLSFATPDAPTKPSVPKPAKTTLNRQDAAPDAATGIQGILSNWQKSKESKREMRSKSFNNSVSSRKAPAPTAAQSIELNE